MKEQDLCRVIYHVADAIRHLPPGEALFKAVRVGCILQGRTLNAVAKDAGKTYNSLKLIIRENSNPAELENVRELAAPAYIQTQTGVKPHENKTSQQPVRAS